MKKTKIISISIDTEFLGVLRGMAKDHGIKNFSRMVEQLITVGYERFQLQQKKALDTDN